ncbi:MAG: UDP-N-acetylmuramate--L-alanine ligase [Chloroflexota bacterium]
MKNRCRLAGSTESRNERIERALRSGGRVHLIGVAGAGMNALAALLLARGCALSGSDQQTSAQVERLIDGGMIFFQGHGSTQINGAELVIISAAIREHNPELAAARAARIPVVKRAEALGMLLRDRRVIAVAGTHGKTTTSAMLAVILTRAGARPTFVVGGEVLDLGASAAADVGEWAVVEADEYDRSFLQLKPETVLITNVEPDHLEYYGTLEAMHEAFRQFIALIRPGGALVRNVADPFLHALTGDPEREMVDCLGEGVESSASWRASDIVEDAHGSRFTLHHPGGGQCPVILPLSGLHNIGNAVQAIAAAARAGVSPKTAAEALRSFRGAGRRFQAVGEAGGVLVIDDYAHHPTEVRATLAAARARYPRRRLIAVFQPHTYSRTARLFDQFVGAFDAADELVVTAIYAARETDTLGMDARRLVEAIAARTGAPPTTYVPDLTAIPAALAPCLHSGDLVLTLGAGSITEIGPRLLAELGGRGRPPAAAGW